MCTGLTTLFNSLQVHYPSDPLQPGPMYFLVPRKCSIFGVHCEGIPRQVNYLNDESGDCGKGANAVVSQLHHFFETHGLGETEVFLHADNCTGQNKNNCMIQYLAWRILTGRHSKITLSFLVVGHTKFAPDWCFGLLKQKYRKTKIGSITGLAAVVNTSAQCNYSQLVTTEDGRTLVKTYDWTTFFAAKFKRVSSIKKIHHFVFDIQNPGNVVIKEHSDTSEVGVSLLKSDWTPNPSKLPAVVQPKGLTPERSWYLYEKIREFCPTDEMDITCPLPTTPKPSSRACSPHELLSEITDPSDATPQPVSATPSTSSNRWCGICRQPGHNSRSCPRKE